MIRIGLCSTDGMYFASGSTGLPGAMFTASHNPAQYNGIKLCRAGASPVGQDTGLAAIKQMVIDGVPSFDGPAGYVRDEDMLVPCAIPASPRGYRRHSPVKGGHRRWQTAW